MKRPLDAFLHHYVSSLARIAQELDLDRVAQAVEVLRHARDAGRTVFVAGNGGSATVAANLVVDLVKCGSFDKEKRFRAINLADAVSTITAYANDEGYETIFAEPLRNFAQGGDVLVAISGSGDSPNVLRAIEAAHDIGCRTLALTSGEQGRLRELAELPLKVPSTHMGRLEDAFFLLTHALAYPFIEEVELPEDAAEPEGRESA
ncbi:MAG: SIS domain-containing protein [Acidobacteriota bacterium]